MAESKVKSDGLNNYYFPELGRSVRAKSLEEATASLEDKPKQDSEAVGKEEAK